jgi:RNA polymerase sigma-70 factor (ECF subfamily)
MRTPWRNMAAEPARAGDAFEREVLQYLDGLYGYALHLSRNPEDASDLVQETYARAFRARSQYQLGTNARAWLFAILRNTFLNARRADGRAPKTVPCEWIDELAEGDENELPIQPSSDPHRCFLNSLLRDDIEKALAELPEEFRSAVVLCDVEEMPYADIADVLGVPIGTVRSRIHRGRAILQKKLRDWNKGGGRGSN